MTPPTEEDTFEIALRVGGVELFALSLLSKSKARNWIVLSMICFAILLAMVSEFGPAVKALVAP